MSRRRHREPGPPFYGDRQLKLAWAAWVLLAGGLTVGGAFVIHMVLHRLSLPAAIGGLMILLGGVLFGMALVVTME